MVNKLQKQKTTIKCKHRISGALRMDITKTMARDFNLLSEWMNSPPSRPVALTAVLERNASKPKGSRANKDFAPESQIFSDSRLKHWASTQELDNLNSGPVLKAIDTSLSNFTSVLHNACAAILSTMGSKREDVPTLLLQHNCET
jgi:hypothetical protein